VPAEKALEMLSMEMNIKVIVAGASAWSDEGATEAVCTMNGDIAFRRPRSSAP
jgi:hypothetical protein